MAVLLERLGRGEVLVLDSAMGTELKRRGIPTPLPAWSAHSLIVNPDAVFAIHRDCVRAGADLLTANTFRTTRRALAKVGAGERAAELTRLASRLARSAAEEAVVEAAEAAAEGAEVEGAAAGGRTQPLVLGSIAPLEDCYSPELVPGQDALAREHAEHAENLAAGGVDALLVETMNTHREAVAAVRAARATGFPVLVSFVADGQGRLFDGEPLAELVPALLDEGVAAVLVNCTPLATTDRILPEIGALAGGAPFGAYANIGFPHPREGWEFADDVSPADYGRHAAEWVRAGARIIGGCCGTTPDHVAAVRAAVDRSLPASTRPAAGLTKELR
jgi:S-methylmethionine-dependent homocysteine/selenocysteine methylase